MSSRWSRRRSPQPTRPRRRARRPRTARRPSSAAGGSCRAAPARCARAGPPGRAGPPCAGRGATPGRRTSGRSPAPSCRPSSPSSRASFARSRAMWYGMITCALRLTRTRSTSMPRAASMSNSDEQRRRVDHDAVADDRGDVRVEHAGRDEVELEDLVPAHDRVAGVVAALVADDHRHLFGQEVGGLALPLVAPLEADDDGRRHQPDALVPRAERTAGKEKAPGRVAWDLVSNLPRRAADASADRRRLVARPPRGTADAPC